MNDICLGVVAMLYTWVIYPLCQKALAKVPIRVMRPAAAIVVAGFVVLCVVKFAQVRQHRRTFGSVSRN